jgi:hypothetical protein
MSAFEEYDISGVDITNLANFIKSQSLGTKRFLFILGPDFPVEFQPRYIAMN